MAHLIETLDISLYASKSNDKEADPQYNHCGKTFQCHAKKMFPKGIPTQFIRLWQKATAEFKGAIKQGQRRVDIHAGLECISSWVDGQPYPDQSFGYVDSMGPPFHHTNHTVSAYGQLYVLVLTIRLFWPKLIKGKIIICTKKVWACEHHFSSEFHSTQPFSIQLVLDITAYFP